METSLLFGLLARPLPISYHLDGSDFQLRQLLLHAINHLRHHLRFVAEKRAAMR
jgi:hypothetical protein